MYYFIGGRNTRNGKGLGILCHSPEFPVEYLTKIERECLEIEADSPQKALLIYPIGNGKMVVMQGKKVGGDYFDGRPHETMHGFLMNIEEFKNVIFRLPAAKEPIFYEKELKENLRKLPKETFERDVKWFEQWEEMDLLEKASYEKRLALFQMGVYLIKHPEESVYLKLEGTEMSQRKLQLEYYQILPYELQERLYTISNGNCLQTTAQILIGTKLDDKNGKKEWKPITIPESVKKVLKLNWKNRKEIYEFTYEILKEANFDVSQLSDQNLLRLYENLWEIYFDKSDVAAGNIIRNYFPKIWNALREKGMIQTHLQTAFPKDEPLVCYKTEVKMEELELQKNKKFVEECWEYLEGSVNPSFLFTRIRNYYQDKEEEWLAFQNELREKLFSYTVPVSIIGKPEEGKIECFAKLLLFAYEYHKNEYYHVMRKQNGLLPAPYDTPKVQMFLAAKKEAEQKRIKRYEDAVIDEYLKTMGFPLKKKKREIKSEA